MGACCWDVKQPQNNSSHGSEILTRVKWTSFETDLSLLSWDHLSFVFLLLLLRSPAISLGFTIFGRNFCVCDRFFNPTVKVVTFRLRGWCVLVVFLLPAFTRLGRFILSSERVFLGNGVWTHVNSQGKNHLYRKFPQRRIEPATLWTASPNTTNELLWPLSFVLSLLAPLPFSDEPVVARLKNLGTFETDLSLLSWDHLRFVLKYACTVAFFRWAGCCTAEKPGNVCHRYGDSWFARGAGAAVLSSVC